MFDAEVVTDPFHKIAVPPTGVASLDLRVQGVATIGRTTEDLRILLVEVKRHGMLDNVAAALQAMRAYGYWIDDAIVQYALREAGEAE